MRGANVTTISGASFKKMSEGWTNCEGDFSDQDMHSLQEALQFIGENDIKCLK